MNQISRITEIIQKLLREIEEEEVGISLLSTHYQDGGELDFFKADDRERVVRILKRLAEDSGRHKQILIEIIGRLEKRRK